MDANGRERAEVTIGEGCYCTASSTQCVSRLFAVPRVQFDGLFALKTCEAVFSPAESFQPKATFTGSSPAVR